MRHGRLAAAALALAGAWLVHIAPAAAQAWPERPVKLIVTQAAGGTPDIIARIVTEEVGKRNGGSFVVENRPGGGNVVGTQAAARSAPDGTPAPIVEQMNRAMDLALKEPAMVKRLAEIGFFTEGAGTLAEAAAYVKAQYEAWGRIIPSIGIKPE